MNDPEPAKITCYSDGEQRMMRRSQEQRGRWLRPLLLLLERLRVRPGHVTLVSLLLGVAFCPALIWGDELAAMTLLLLHVISDGLDGPLARHLGRASNRGSFTDTMADQVVVTFSTLTLIHVGLAALWPGVLYLFFYTMVVVFAFVRNALAIPYSWLVRPRFFVYLCIPVSIYLWRPSLDLLLWTVSALLAWKTLTGFIQIRRRI
ncbi:MAG TPA: hypothetical protein DCY13_24095 [Verrucomicrobiales bacterium]|nr:hypothetical protein [Verrucomicrobiales bacterium]